jgi:hypothetical protein
LAFSKSVLGIGGARSLSKIFSYSRTSIAEMIDNWKSCPDEDVGWCLLCDGPIRSENDIMPNSNTHN